MAQWLKCCATNRKVVGSIPQSAVSSGRVWSICSERATREECCFVFCVNVCLHTSLSASE